MSDLSRRPRRESRREFKYFGVGVSDPRKGQGKEDGEEEEDEDGGLPALTPRKSPGKENGTFGKRRGTQKVERERAGSTLARKYD